MFCSFSKCVTVMELPVQGQKIGFYMGFIWVLYGFYMGFIYFDMGFMIVSCSVVFFGVGADRILMGSAHRRCRGTTILEQ